MRFNVTGTSNIVCCGCGGITHVAPKRVYQVKDLTCNCEDKGEVFKFEVSHITDISGLTNGQSTRVEPDGVYLINADGDIEEIMNGNISMFEEPYHKYAKTSNIEVIGQDNDGNVLVQNVGDSSDRWVIPSTVFNETYEPIETPPAANVNDDIVNHEKGFDFPEPTQTQMFVEEPENVIDPAETNMNEDEVRAYLKELGWQELLEAAKNNNVTKPPKANREELEEMIVQKVFHE